MATLSSKSWVWQNFNKVCEETAECRICDKLISRSGGSTSGMRNHLKVHLMYEPESKQNNARDCENEKSPFDKSRKEAKLATGT